VIERKIVNYRQIKSSLSSYKKDKKSIVLTGGCFDIIHIGHIRFLAETHKNADILIVLLENDERVRILKGQNRPFFTQTERGCVLSALNSVDLVINLPLIKNDIGYENIISEINPQFIALTENDPIIEKKKIQAKKAGAQIIKIPFIKTYSTSKIAEIIGID
jgi:FAD synthetase